MPPSDQYSEIIEAAKRAQPVMDSLARQRENDLFVVVAVRADEPQRNSRHGFDVPFDSERLPLDSTLQELGRRIFVQWSRALHEFVCTPGKKDAALRSQLLTAITGKEGGAMALLAAVLVGSFGLSAPLSAAVAALTFKLIVNPAGAELCAFWSERLNAISAPSAGRQT
jgi:hypothetical protein